jgi:hypothetical protein
LFCLLPRAKVGTFAALVWFQVANQEKENFREKANSIRR